MDMIYAHPDIKPTYIQDTIKAQLELEVTRSQCKRANAIVIKRLENDVLHEYKTLNDYARALVDTNPGSSIDIEVEHGEGYALNSAWKRPNNQMFSVAWEIVEIESESSWTLVLRLATIFLKAEHRLCARHIYANWYSDFHGEQLKVAFYAIAKCANEAQLQKRLYEIENIYNGAKKFLEKKDIKEWCRACFKGYSKCDLVDNNSTEAWNFVLIRARRQVVKGEEFLPNSGPGELIPPLPKAMPGRPGSDHPAMLLTNIPFNGSNFHGWSRNVKMALGAKLKLGFIDGSYCRLSVDNVGEERLGKSNGPLIYQLEREPSQITQGNLTMASFFNKLKKCWDDLQNLNGLSTCYCGKMRKCTCYFIEKFVERESNSKLIQFLMKLSNGYKSVRSQILAIDPLLSVNKAHYHRRKLVQKEKGQKYCKLAAHVNSGFKEHFHWDTPFDLGTENEVVYGQNGRVDQKLVAAVCQEMMKIFKGKNVMEDRT
ncbi:elongation factor G, III-V domain-containing protein [Tanacetum coccineum]